MRRSRKKRSALEKAAADRFREAVLQEPCLFSQCRPEHRCSGPIDCHHVVEKQFLRTHFSTMGEDKWVLVYSPEIGVPLCRAAHDAVTVHSGYVFLEELPARVIDFCDAWRIRWRLERECPSLHGVGEQRSENGEHG